LGTGQSIFKTNFADDSLLEHALMGPGVFIICAIIKLTTNIRHYIKTGRWFSKDNSAWRTAQGTFQWTNIVALLGNSLTNIGSTVATMYALIFAKRGGLSYGYVAVLRSLSALTNLVAFAFWFGEKVTKAHIFGILIMITSVYLLTVTPENSDPVNTTY
jgi:drug/metabolite transporter (DMT)-like permease